MLAYLFWHEPRAGADADAYVARLQAFHGALAAAPPPSFVRSWSVRLDVAPWDAGPARLPFEDWYLVGDWAALGTLNEAAVRAPREEAHDAIAAMATNGAGALYALQHGTLSGPSSWAGWVVKPPGEPYATFEPRLRAVAGISGPFCFGELWDDLPQLTRETFMHKSGASDAEDGRRRALALDLEGVLERLDVPALFVTGKLDRLIPWESTRRQADAAPRGEFVLFDDGNHVCANIPYKARPLVADWLAQQLA